MRPRHRSTLLHRPPDPNPLHTHPPHVDPLPYTPPPISSPHAMFLLLLPTPVLRGYLVWRVSVSIFSKSKYNSPPMARRK
jgi:hypothetical protein